MEERKTYSKSLDMNSLSAQNSQHSTAQHSTAQHSTAQHSTAQHSTAPAITLPEILFRAIRILNQTYRLAEWLQYSHTGKPPMMQDKLCPAHGLLIAGG